MQWLKLLGALALAAVLAVALYRVATPPPQPQAPTDEELRRAEQELRDRERENKEKLDALRAAADRADKSRAELERERAELARVPALRAAFERVANGMTEAEVDAVMGPGGKAPEGGLPVPANWTVREWAAGGIRFRVFFEDGKVFKKLGP